MKTYAEKARESLDAAATYQKADGIAASDWPSVACLLSIANTQAQVSIAESLEKLAAKHGRSHDTEPERTGAYL